MFADTELLSTPSSAELGETRRLLQGHTSRINVGPEADASCVEARAT